MTLHHAHTFPHDGAWSGTDIADIAGAAVKLRWTDQPYRWHVNTGAEIFMVLDGTVDMHIREAGVERVQVLTAGDILHLPCGAEHVAHPRGPARLLVVEEKGSD